MPPTPADRDGAAGPASALWHTVWLVVALIGVKASYVLLSRFWTWAAPRDYASWLYLKWLAAVSQQDVVFALGFGLVAAGALRAVRDRPVARRRVGVGLAIAGSGCVLYAVVSRQAFTYYSAPLTYQLLGLSGEPARLWSSIAAFVTIPVLIALVALPIGYFFLVQACARRAARPATRLVLATALIGWIVLGRLLLGTPWFDAQDRYLPENPHGVLLGSIFPALPGMRSSLAATTVHESDLLEFSPADASSPPTAAGEPSRPRPRNVILVVLESVGARPLSLYGQPLDTTPCLLMERENALVFDRYYAPVAWTAYSLIALVESQRPPMERYNELSFRAEGRAGQSLPQVLASAGFRTAFMAAGDPDWASAGFLERNGFQEVVRGMSLPRAATVSSWGTEDRVLFDGMLAWLDQSGPEPFFLMAWTDQTHHPYTIGDDQDLTPVIAPGKDGNDSTEGRYLRLVREADAQIGRLLDGLRQRGLADDTLVVITGDHGEAFGEPHGGGGHGFTVYQEEVWVPLLLWNPPLFRGQGRSRMVGSHKDLAPTVLDLLGLPPHHGWDGRSLFDATRASRAYLFAAAWGQYLLGVVDDDWKYIYDARLGYQELYNLSADRDEQQNLALIHPERAQRARERLAAWLRVEHQRSAERRDHRSP